MSQIPTVIVSAGPLLLSRLGRALEGLDGIRLCGQASDLSGAYVRVEQAEPKLVILGAELMRHPDFPGLLAMFRVMGIAWMRIASEAVPSRTGRRGPCAGPRPSRGRDAGGNPRGACPLRQPARTVAAKGPGPSGPQPAGPLHPDRLFHRRDRC